MMEQEWFTGRAPSGRKARARQARGLPTIALSRRAVEPDPTRNEATILEGPRFVPVPAEEVRPQIVANYDDEQVGLDILSRLAVNDTSVIGEYGLLVSDQDRVNTQKHEWGLGIRIPSGSESRVYSVYAGGRGEIDWKTLTGAVPVAHTHPFDKSVTRGEFNRDLGQQFTSLAQMLGYWLSSRDRFELAFDYMPGNLWYLFPSNADLIASFTGESTRSEIVYTPYRLGKDGWLSRDDGPPLSVEFGPVYAVLADDADKIISSSQGQFQSDPEQLLSKCVFSYVTQSTFKAKGLPDICTGWQSCDPHASGTGAGRFAPGPPAGKQRMTRREVYEFIDSHLS